ncbi:g696 [Coccomyxa elongata]
METTEASWVTMVMDRLHQLEQANDALRSELELLRPKPEPDSSSSSIQVWVPCREATIFDVFVYTDRPGLGSLKDFGKALLNMDPEIGEATLSMIPFSDVWGDSAPLKRHIFCITGIVGPTRSQTHIVTMLEGAWGSSILPDSMPVHDLFVAPGNQSHLGGPNYCMCQFVQRTDFFDIWSAMIGQAEMAHDFTRTTQGVRASRPPPWEQVTEADPSAWRARLTTAVGIDRFELHGASALKVQAALHDWDEAFE